METNTSRQPKGVRVGGQFAAIAHSEPTVTLAPVVDTRPGAGTPPLGKRELLGPGTLAERSPAWTPTAVKKFLGEPDKLIRNPVYRNGPPMRMFSTERVEKIEGSEEWKAWEEASRRRSAASGRRKEEKTEPKVELGHGRNGFYPVVRRQSGRSWRSTHVHMRTRLLTHYEKGLECLSPLCNPTPRKTRLARKFTSRL